MVKVDFVSALQDGKVVLSDWKTGVDDDSYETRLQLAAYVLWAMDYYQKPQDEILTELVFLKTGEKKAWVFTEEQLQEVRETIRMDSEAMNLTYELEGYPPSPFPKECLSCRYARICSCIKL
jgi:CRISPR/Cas system-associated exonuclease Cas4 (RecB family)